MELTPKQQVTELIRQANTILLVTGREPNNDQLASLVAMQAILTKLGKNAYAIVSDSLPKIAPILDTTKISQGLDGVRDFIISLDMSKVTVDKLKYTIEDGKLNIVVTPHQGSFTAQDASYGYGAYQFDLVIAIGVPSLTKLDRLHEANPTIFDGIHLINIDYHRINDSYGSVNLVDQSAASVAEILVSITESLGQGLIDAHIATAMLAGIMASTNRFSAPNTTPKAMTVAAQLMAAGAKQQEIVKVLYSSENGHGQADSRSKKKPINHPPARLNGPQQVSNQVNPSDHLPAESTARPVNSSALSANAPVHLEPSMPQTPLASMRG